MAAGFAAVALTAASVGVLAATARTTGTVGGSRLGAASACSSHELVCNLPRHYASGMYAELDVT